MHSGTRIISLALCAACTVACGFVSSLVHDDEVAARVGRHVLYKSDVAAYIPSGVGASDSTNLALQYINSWATDMVFLDAAESELSKQELDVEADLESYRRSLLRFRYEQRYVSDRLDTVITPAQMQAFYDTHKSLFQLSRPVMKVRFISILKTSPRKDMLIRRMSSDKDAVETDSLAGMYAIRYFDKSEDWIDAQALADEFGVSCEEMMSCYSRPYIRIESPSEPDVKAAYVRQIVQSGTAPLEFCSESIRDHILSARKHELLMSLERDLLRQSLDQDKFVIY